MAFSIEIILSPIEQKGQFFMNNHAHRRAMGFVLLLGVVSLFADMTYEAARSLSGPYLAILGASGAIVGFTAGAGELLGYGLRFFSGLLSDKTQRYWLMTIAGYAVNLLAVPLLALAGHWGWAVGLIMAERFGKALRTPARDTMLSCATSVVGRGWGFAVHEAMDQIGAMAGPLIVMIVLAVNSSYRFAFAVLAIPAVLALSVLIAARVIFPHPHKLEEEIPQQGDGKFPAVLWLYLAAVGFVAAGFADYPLIAFHIKSHALLADKWIPLLYACAMGIDALAALGFGRWYDKNGVLALAGAVIISSIFALFAFSFRPAAVIAGILLWGIGMGAQESIIRAAVADMVPRHRRGTGFGLFNSCFGIAWFAGSFLMGILYDVSLPALIGFSIAAQLASLPLLLAVQKRLSPSK
ncbi:MAG TPA: MFS transporter [Anaerohalosphaeraceae bacterium]|nr:MFS transporter [Anaerohalosphaeraceae bacterium]HOL31509.1 MFS transporter [Anaerohalosphaeraceae bacterium]HOM75568.1 MFS transporter [Anaerohalosphaeraceae bacterium]HPC64350.1 MFS transporter [Anaerohalosphaeraceae bacterium]HPO69160.1 MFS transporter [Anaerohalosphaeraceae bacterium]